MNKHIKKNILIIPLIIWFAGCNNFITRGLTTDKEKGFFTELAHIPEGEFIMGMDEMDSDEAPVKSVYLDAYYINRYEITNKDFSLFIEAEGYKKKRFWSEEGWKVIKGSNITAPHGWGESPEQYDIKHPGPLSVNEDYPVVGVSWYEAEAFCNWAGMRLPTEAEWEKAGRGTDGRRYPWGNEFNFEKANITSKEDNFSALSPVGSFPKGASIYGVIDMSGNAIEWTADWYSEDYYKTAEKINPRGPKEGDSRVDRDVTCSPQYARITNRGFAPPSNRFRDRGFRCAKDTDKKGTR